MKKITLIILISGILLASTPVSSTILPKDIKLNRSLRTSFERIEMTTWTPDILYDGNFTGWFGIRNDEENYNILGYVQGHFIYKFSFFSGQWNMADDSLGGFIFGFFGINSLLGWIQIGLGKFFLLGIGLPFIGSYQINETSHEFTAEIFRFIFPNIHFCCEYYIFEE